MVIYLRCVSAANGSVPTTCEHLFKFYFSGLHATHALETCDLHYIILSDFRNRSLIPIYLKYLPWYETRYIEL